MIKLIHLFQKTVQVFAHCVGAITFFMSLLSGALDGKIRTIVVSQVACNTIPDPFNLLKSTTRIPDALSTVGIKGLNAETSVDAPLPSRMLNGLLERLVNQLTVPLKERCPNPVCHRYVHTCKASIPDKNQEYTLITMKSIF